MPARLARGRPSATPAAARPAARDPTALPAYEAPAAALNARALQTLEGLAARHAAEALRKRQKDAAAQLAEVAQDVHERLFNRRREAASAAKRAAVAARARDPAASSQPTDGGHADGAEGDGESARIGADVEALAQKVDEITGDLEESVRRVIDEQARTEAAEKALREASVNTVRAGGRVDAAAMATQSTLGASQFRSATDPDDEDEDLDENDDDGEDGSRRRCGENGENASTSFNDVLKAKAEKHDQEWNELSMRAR